MKKSLRSDARGIAHIAIILLVVLILVIGAAGYMVMKKNKKTNSSTTGTPAAAVVANAEVEKECKKLYNDDDFCKFASRWNASASYKATFTHTGKDGKVSTMSIESDSKNNSSVVSKEDGKEQGAYISLDGDTYMKDIADNSWTKYPKSTQTTAEQESAQPPTESIKFDTKEEEAKPEAERDVYKKVGKEKCGNATCFKYQMIDPKSPKYESFLWFGDKDYQLRKWSQKDADGNVDVIEYEFANVTIKVPSPVKDAPAAPSQADIQNYINQAQNSAGTE